MFAKRSMINRLSNPIYRNRSAAKISKVMSSSANSKHDVVNVANFDAEERVGNSLVEILTLKIADIYAKVW